MIELYTAGASVTSSGRPSHAASTLGSSLAEPDPFIPISEMIFGEEFLSIFTVPVSGCGRLAMVYFFIMLNRADSIPCLRSLVAVLRTIERDLLAPSRDLPNAAILVYSAIFSAFFLFFYSILALGANLLKILVQSLETVQLSEHNELLRVVLRKFSL